MSRVIVAIAMLVVLSTCEVLGFTISPGPQKPVGFLVGWLVGAILIGLIGKSQLAQQFSTFIEMSLLFSLLGLGSLAIRFFIHDEEIDSIDGLLLLISIVMISVALPFGVYGILGWSLHRKQTKNSNI